METFQVPWVPGSRVEPGFVYTHGNFLEGRPARRSEHQTGCGILRYQQERGHHHRRELSMTWKRSCINENIDEIPYFQFMLRRNPSQKVSHRFYFSGHVTLILWFFTHYSTFYTTHTHIRCRFSRTLTFRMHFTYEYE